ncbi:MAG: adenylate/guanylate cyclase domain-containing protein [Actinomycetota bacterium]|nr:adenylate/guanylate cyclase domain-containing protein [Actinomycetota bacterium]
MERPLIRYTKTIDGLHIAYQVVGSGPFDLLYAPGWFSNLECAWEVPELGEFLAELASLSRLILFDRRGFGLSDSPTTTGLWSLELGMDDIRAVMDAAGSERAVLFGMDDGGALCTLFAASNPGRVSALVLFAVWAKYFRSPDYPWGWTKQQDEIWMQRVENHWGTEEFWADSAYVSPHISRDAGRVRAWARYARLSASRGAALAIARMQMETDIRAVLPAVMVPTLVMHRTDDTAEPVEQARYIGEHVPNADVVELPGTEHAPFAGDAERVLREVRRFVSAVRDEEAEFDRVLATVLFTDLVGSTERAAAVGDRAWRELVERHHTIIRRLLARYRGTEVDTAGDGFFATFDGPARAVRCARAIIDAVQPLGLDVRAGVHTGEVETIDGKAGGLAVNIGARVAASAARRELLVSSTVKDLTAGSGLEFEDAGQRELKGIPDAWHLFRVVNAAM